VKPRGWLMLAAMALVVGCASDKRFVANAAAARIYHEDRYERLCVAVKGPATCSQMQAALQDWKHADELANTVQKLGALPKEEKAEIAALIDKVRKLP